MCNQLFSPAQKPADAHQPGPAGFFDLSKEAIETKFVKVIVVQNWMRC
jgi:hypothetical protein